MKPFKKILVASDFTEHSMEALRYAADLARVYDGSLLIVHVYQPIEYALPDGYMMFTPEQMTRMMGELEERLERVKVDALAAGAPRVETSLPIGTSSFEIVEAARESDCDLIVMGTHGRTGLKHVLLGSTAERVVRTAHCPVLTVRSEAALTGLRGAQAGVVPAVLPMSRPDSGFAHYLRDVVYGASDGVVTTLAILAGVAGASFKPEVGVVLGLANVVAGLAATAAYVLGWLVEPLTRDSSP